MDQTQDQPTAGKTFSRFAQNSSITKGSVTNQSYNFGLLFLAEIFIEATRVVVSTERE